jgi:hypothetical protein
MSEGGWRPGKKLDTHVHTHYSGMTHIWPLSYIVRESYNTPERVYRLAKARGMDLVAITDHDTVEGAMRLAHLPDVVVGCEVSAHFPGHGVDVHLGVLDLTPEQHAEIDRRRHDVAVLLPYLRQQEIFTVINHVASQVNGRLTATLIASLLPWVDAFEVRNGSPCASRTAPLKRSPRRRGNRGSAAAIRTPAAGSATPAPSWTMCTRARHSWPGFAPAVLASKGGMAGTSRWRPT